MQRGHPMVAPMRELLFVLVLVVAVVYWILHPDQVQSAVGWFVGQIESVVDWVVGQVHR
jgi:hypothetical protein